MKRIQQTLKASIANANSNSDSLPAKPLPTAAAEVVARYGTAEQFLIALNPDVQTLVAQNPQRAFLGTAPSIGTLALAYSKEVAQVWIMAQLENLNDFVAIKEKLAIAPMQALAKLIACEYGFLKTTELMLFFHRFKAGKYGSFYGCIDPLKITQSLNQFTSDRIAEIYKYENQQKELQLEKDRLLWAKTAVSRAEYEALKRTAEQK